MKGTKILTLGGYRAVETLNIGDIILTHTRKQEEIIDITRQIIKWNKYIPKELRIYKIPGLCPTFITRNQKIVVSEGAVFITPMSSYSLAKKRDICVKTEYYEVFTIHIKNHETNYLLVNYGKIVES